uniref:tyrosine-type recombinase/integrase n=1 Tax=Bacillus litorisediminis TaxID=2922713 RepID=UPI0028BD40F0|nr:site-specific integrase [Bacillus litorisediminis]
MPFDKVALEWLEVYALTGVKKNTIRVRKKEIQILNRYIAKVNIDKISSKMYQSILTDLSKPNPTRKPVTYARTTIEGVHTTAGMIFKYAIKEKMIKESPTTHAIIPKQRKTVEEIENQSIEEEYLELDEISEFLGVVEKHGLYLDVERFYLLAFSGMRPGELCALKWTDISFSKRTVRVTKTLVNENNNMREYELTPPKTEGSIRTFDVPEHVINILKQHKMKQMRLLNDGRKKYKDFHEGNFVFCRENGYPFAPKNILDRMKRLLEKTSIQKHATPHIFRHTHISMLAAAGVDLPTIMERVGHEDVKTTMRIYMHVTKKMKEDASIKINETLRNILDFKVSL